MVTTRNIPLKRGKTGKAGKATPAKGNKGKGKGKGKKGKEARQDKKLQGQIEKDMNFGQEMADKFGITTPLERLDTTRPEALQKLLDQSEADYQAAGQRSEEMKEYVSLMKSGLGGLTAEENQASRERALEEMGRALAMGTRQQAMAQAGSGVRGAAAAAGNMALNRQFMTDTRGLERDLLLDNIAIQDSRRDAFGNLLGGLEADEWGRSREAFRDHSQIVSGDVARGDSISQFNLQRGDTERARNEAAMMGWAGLLDSRRQTRFSNKLARDSLNKPTSTQVGGGGGGGGGYDTNGYITAMGNLINTTYPQAGAQIGIVPPGFSDTGSGGGI